MYSRKGKANHFCAMEKNTAEDQARDEGLKREANRTIARPNGRRSETVIKEVGRKGTKFKNETNVSFSKDEGQRLTGRGWG